MLLPIVAKTLFKGLRLLNPWHGFIGVVRAIENIDIVAPVISIFLLKGLLIGQGGLGPGQLITVFLFIAENMVVLRFLILFHFLLCELFETVVLVVFLLNDGIFIGGGLMVHAGGIDGLHILCIVFLGFTFENLKIVMLVILEPMVVHIVENTRFLDGLGGLGKGLFF